MKKDKIETRTQVNKVCIVFCVFIKFHLLSITKICIRHILGALGYFNLKHFKDSINC